MFKLLLVDDFFVERENVKEILSTASLDIELVGEAANGAEACENASSFTMGLATV